MERPLYRDVEQRKKRNSPIYRLDVTSQFTTPEKQTANRNDAALMRRLIIIIIELRINIKINREL